MGHLQQECPLLQCDIGWEIHLSSHLCPGKTLPLTVLVRLGHKTVTALLDTGSSVSLIRAHLIPQDRLILRYTAVAGVYRQVCRWPVVQMSLGYNNTTYSLDILKVDDLPFPVLFGRDTPAFDVLIRAALPRLTKATSDNEVPGSIKPVTDEQPLDTTSGGEHDEFLKAQETESKGRMLDAR